MVESENHTKKIKNIILELEHESKLFRPDEVVNEAGKEAISEKETRHIIDNLKESGYLHVVRGTDGLLARTVWKDYSPAFEELPDF